MSSARKVEAMTVRLCVSSARKLETKKDYKLRFADRTLIRALVILNALVGLFSACVFFGDRVHGARWVLVA